MLVISILITILIDLSGLKIQNRATFKVIIALLWQWLVMVKGRESFDF